MLQGAEKELVQLIASQCKTVGDVQSVLKSLFQGTLETMLEAEMDEHLGYEKHDNGGDGSGNSRNGYGKKRSKASWERRN